MIDIHTHLIPGIDDGSESYDETKRICEMLYEQGVDRIVATPHFYADSSNPEDFIERRDASFETMQDLAEKYHIIKGAEVRYYSGIGRSEGIDMLLIEGTRFLLLELTERRVNDFVINDLMKLRSRNIRPIIAHLNRYREFRDNGFIEFCNMNGIPIQLNTECILSRFSRRRAIDLIASERVQFLATDCHDVAGRKPEMKEAVDVVRRYLGDEITDDFIRNEGMILDE